MGCHRFICNNYCCYHECAYIKKNHFKTHEKQPALSQEQKEKVTSTITNNMMKQANEAKRKTPNPLNVPNSPVSITPSKEPVLAETSSLRASRSNSIEKSEETPLTPEENELLNNPPLAMTHQPPTAISLTDNPKCNLIDSQENNDPNLIGSEFIKSCKNNDLNKIKQLFNENNLDVNLKYENESLLYHAVKNQSSDVVEFLLSKNANCQESNARGETALSLAYEESYDDIADLISSHITQAYTN